MNSIFKKMFLALAVMVSLPTMMQAQTKFKVNGELGFVSDYVWRGADQYSGFSVQPSLTLGYGGFSLNLWGNQTLSKWEDGKGQKEVDINLSYAYKNFSITISDYWWAGTDMPYGDYKNDHYFEGTLAFNFGESFPLELAWSTMFAGGDKNENGHLMASSYLNIAYPFSLPADITLTPAVGFTPWKGMYWDKAAFTDITLTANKDIKVNEHFVIPIFLQAVVSPIYDRTYLLGGISFGF